MFEGFGEKLSIDGLELDYNDIEEKFAAKVVVKKEEDKTKKKGPSVFTCLDPKISQNLVPSLLLSDVVDGQST